MRFWVPVSWNAAIRSRSGRVDPGRLVLVLAAVGLVFLGLAVAWIGQGAAAAMLGTPGVAWTLSPASNTVAIRLTPGSGPDGQEIVSRSHLVVSGADPARPSPDGAAVRVPVPPGTRTRLQVQVDGPRPEQQTLTVAMPRALRVTRSRPAASGVIVTVSGALRRRAPRPLCGKDTVSFPAPRVAAVASGPAPCRAVLRVTARSGEQAAVRVTIPALHEIPVYSFANPAHRAIYITVDDGWTPSAEVLDLMRQTHLPVTAFLILRAAQRNLPYWRAFVAAGGTVGDHTVSHPNLTKVSLRQATTQWGQAGPAWRAAPPHPGYGAAAVRRVDRTVEAAAFRGGLTALVGWSATVGSTGGVHTWDGRKLEPGEIVLLHWVPGLGRQMVRLLRVIHAQHLNPTPLTPADFTGVTPQRRSLDGD